MVSILYGHPVSQPARSCQWLIEYLNKKDVEVKFVDVLKGEHKEPKYLEKFPNGQVPSFENENGFCFSESLAIIQYLSDGDEMLKSSNKRQQARLDEYFGRHYSIIRKCSTEFFRHFIFTKEGKKEQMASGYEKIKPTLQFFDDILRKQKFILGNSVSLADFLFAPEVDQLQFPGDEYLAPYQNIKRYLKRLDTDVIGYTNCFNGADNAIKGLTS